MCPLLNNPESRPDHEEAFSLVELLVAVSITTVIIFALYAIFDHTQKAFRGSISQVDVMESGRAAMDLITRDLEQLSASNEANVTNLFARVLASAVPLSQLLPGDTIRTNQLQDFFFLSRINNNWSLSGYSIVPALTNSPVGTLNRFSASTNSIQRKILFDYIAMYFQGSLPTVGWAPVIDGVVHLTFLPYDGDGSLRSRTRSGPSDSQEVKPYERSPVLMSRTITAPGFVFDNRTAYRYFCVSNALPPFIEVQLGILEPQILEQYKSMPSNVASNFLARQAGRVHLFRQRIAIHTAAR